MNFEYDILVLCNIWFYGCLAKFLWAVCQSKMIGNVATYSAHVHVLICNQLNTTVLVSICNQLMLVRASMCVCVCSLLLLHSCLFNILTYCISCGEEPDFPGLVLDCMITDMILNLVLILNKSSIQFILVNLSDRQLLI